LKGDHLTHRAYRLAIPILGLWLAVWIAISWPGIQDDALIHLRYADNLFQTHLITYDGVHPNYGASSLLYVYLLSSLRTFSASPNLPRIVSTCAHIFLVAGLATLFYRSFPRDSSLARLLGLILLLILVGPSAVRWLDDGMETSLALCFTALLCWATFRQCIRPISSRSHYIALAALGFFIVLLRTELILLCGLAFAILASTRIFNAPEKVQPKRLLEAFLHDSHLLVGGILAVVLIRVKMHAFLPDTAVAKSHGLAKWYEVFPSTVTSLGASFSFGAGMLLLWTVSILLLFRVGRFSLAAFFANLPFPVLFFIAALRGQQVQGARYLAWTFFFSILWNILELSLAPPDHRSGIGNNKLAYRVMALLLIALPLESTILYKMLRSRADLTTQFESEDFENLHGKRGIAFDIGFIGYFSRADICDLGGLVNGSDKARLTPEERLAGCANTHPDFMFLDLGRIKSISRKMAISDWQVCSTYEFKNVFQSQPHYLIVPRSTASEVCRAVSNSVPSDIEPLVH
jgi:hypothetical protein